MKTASPLSEYLVISRGQWDPDRSPAEIQDAIDRFYAWHDEQVAAGRMRPGQRLAREGRLVTRQRIVDGPFAESKEVVGGYWFILADSLEEAARLAAANPCLDYGLAYEIRPIEARRASAFALASETPVRHAPTR
ncbi:YciI family protein [Fulvimonas yonginensis]|uniref:YciI family protein n=1 Tax=Fulvimonas yonginensis TaxID=1495200 RepID=A0ABU8J949_9GAMM